MNHAIPSLLAVSLSLAIVAPATFAKDASINCDTAQQDIAHLESEKKSSLEQMEKGVTSIMPSTAALHLITGTQQESKEIATGEYNDKIDAQVAKIRSTCGID
jgi:hypothetical protein